MLIGEYMEEIIKTSIKGRYDALFNAYMIKDEKIKEEIDTLFKKINEFGEQYNSIEKFESDFQADKLNQEYINLFTKIATSCKPIVYESNNNVKDNSHPILDELASDAKYIADDLTMPARRKAREEFDKKMRDTPLGKIEQANNMRYLFKRIFKK